MKKRDLYDKACEFIDQRNFIGALILLEELRELNPENSFIEFKIAQIKARNKRTLSEAREIFEKLLKGNNKHTSAALLELGKLEVLERNYNKAKSHFNKLIKREEDSLAYIELAKLEIKFRNFNEAKRLLQILIDKHNQYEESALLELGKLERLQGNIAEAINCFDKISFKCQYVNKRWIELELARINFITGQFEEGISILRKLLHTNVSTEALVEMVKVYIRIEKYELAYQYNNELQRRVGGKVTLNTQLIDSFLKYKMGILETEMAEETYFMNQLQNYSREEAIKHIEKHLDEDNEKALHSLYSENIDIDELYEYTKAAIQDIKSVDGSLNDKYIVRYHQIVGTVFDELTDTLQVITIPNTKDIITIYPVPAANGKLEIEQKPLKQKQKVKESQIDKFNRRYGKK